MHGAWWAILLLGMGAAHASASDAIYRCAGDAGEVMFSGVPCPGGVVEVVRDANVVDMPPPAADERAALTRIERDIAPRTDRAGRGAAPRAQAANARRCVEAQAALDRVRAVKRRGYRVSGAQALDARERESAARRDRECG
jgi:hypothetical protein